MELSVKGLTWRPSRRRTPVLRDLDLQVPAGQRVLITGPSGAGKSTLLRALAGLLLTAADGDLEGTVLLDGSPVAESAQRPALLFQDPTSAIVADTVGRDVAFGLENAGVPADQIWARVEAALDSTGFPYPVGHPTSALSGGESQRLALAGSLAMGSRVLLLDEPVSMLDASTAGSVLDAVRRYADDSGATTVVVDHQLEPWVPLVDRLIVLGGDGSVVADGDVERVLSDQREFLLRHGVWVPGAPPPCPVAIDGPVVEPWRRPPDDLLEARAVTLELSNRLSRRTSPTLALAGVDARLQSGRALAVTGASGAGKSSLVSLLAGLRAPTTGEVTTSDSLATRRGREPSRWSSRDLARRFAWVPQHPEHGVVTQTVSDEVLAAARACGRDGERAGRRGGALLESLGLTSLADASPYHLSGGEQRRLMVAAALVAGPCALLLDEPTVGQDRLTWAAIVGVLASARSVGVGVALASHDVRAVDVLADDVLALEHGRAVG